MKPIVSKEFQSRTIFIAGDLKTYAGKFETNFCNEGFNIIFSEDLRELYEYLEIRQPEAVILYLSSSYLSKSEIKKIRKSYTGILILLTEITDARFHISILEVGADELLNKSSSIEFQIERLKILIGRYESKNNSMNHSFKIGEIKINIARREVFLKDKLININSVEFEILLHLVNNIGKVVSRDELHNKLYKSDYNGIDRSLDINLSRIRSKLCDNPKDPKYIKTIRGEGYLFLPEL
jgi:two-component system response regulator RstA